MSVDFQYTSHAVARVHQSDHAVARVHQSDHAVVARPQVAHAVTIAPATGPLRSNLTAAWRLEEASGTRASSVGTFNLTQAGGVGTRGGVQGNAADFTRASTQYLSIASEADLQLGGVDWTIAMWIYADDTVSSTYLSKDDGTDREYLIWYLDGLRITVWNTDASTANAYPTGFGAGAWHHVVARYNAATDQLIATVDAGPKATASNGGKTVESAAAPFALGGRQWLGNELTMDGALDEVLLYKGYYVPDAAVTWLYNSGAGRSFAELGNWSE